MSRRIDIELTSALDDGSWTWRAAGAREPRGVLDGAILPDGAAVGDEVKVEVDQMLDGVTVLSVVKGREKQTRDLLEMLPAEESFDEVIQTRARRERGEGGRRKDDRRKDDRRKDGRRKDGRRRGGRRDDSDRAERPERPHFDPPPEVPQRPKPKRLKPGKTHRTEVLAEIPEAQRSIAEVALQGMPAVRTRLAEENRRLADAGQPEMPEAAVIKMAEDSLPKLRVAEWLDRAEAAQRQMQHLDLRDLRSVVAASDDPMVARDESTRVVAEELKQALAAKQEEELQLWLVDVAAALDVGRVIRALRLSSQPPKAGVMFPPDLARRLGEAATAALDPADTADRWAAVMEAAAFSPVRTLVEPTTPPTVVTDDLRATALRLGPLLPQIAALLQVEVPADAPRPRPLRPQPRKDQKRARSGGGRGRDGRSGGSDGRSDGRNGSERRRDDTPG